MQSAGCRGEKHCGVLLAQLAIWRIWEGLKGIVQDLHHQKKDTKHQCYKSGEPLDHQMAKKVFHSILIFNGRQQECAHYENQRDL